jgi:hypothetical protein
MGKNLLEFNDETIQRLFGHEAAEDEDKTRLREYYFKSDVFSRITASLPLRVLVGHKGIGKSALFTVAMQEDHDNGIVAMLIRPDDVVEIETGSNDILQAIRNWKIGLIRIIFHKVLGSLGIADAKEDKTLPIFSGKVINFVADVLQPVLKKYVDQDATRRQTLAKVMASKHVNVYLDDLDRGWKAAPTEIGRLSALLNALRDLSKEYEGLHFRVALRSDVYFLVRTSDESTDKIEGSVVWHTWSNHEILAMFVKRIESFFGRSRDEKELMSMVQPDLARFLDPVMERVFEGYGHWMNCPTYRVLMSLIRKRPRDIVKLTTLAAQKAGAAGRSKIGTKDLNDSFTEYSQGRLQDTTNEFRSELPEIERVLLGMKPNKQERQCKRGYVYTTDELFKKIKNIEQGGNFTFYGGRRATPRGLAQFMYKINFLTARKEVSTGTIIRKYFEENRYLASELADFGFDWEVHPAYRWALQPDDLKSIFSEFKPSSDG